MVTAGRVLESREPAEEGEGGDSPGSSGSAAGFPRAQALEGLHHRLVRIHLQLAAACTSIVTGKPSLYMYINVGSLLACVHACVCVFSVFPWRVSVMQSLWIGKAE